MRAPTLTPPHAHHHTHACTCTHTCAPTLRHATHGHVCRCVFVTGSTNPREEHTPSMRCNPHRMTTVPWQFLAGKVKAVSRKELCWKARVEASASTATYDVTIHCVSGVRAHCSSSHSHTHTHSSLSLFLFLSLPLSLSLADMLTLSHSTQHTPLHTTHKHIQTHTQRLSRHTRHTRHTAILTA
jgi:hypothetical protein